MIKKVILLYWYPRYLSIKKSVDILDPRNLTIKESVDTLAILY